MNYANISLDNNFLPRQLSHDEILERDIILERMKKISEKLDKVKARPIPRVISNRHPSGFSLNRKLVDLK